MKKCEYEGCERKHVARGFCGLHYGRLLATGTPDPSSVAHAGLEERFWRKVDKTGDCWLWTGAVMANGYGRIRQGGKGSPVWNAHRASYEINFGPIPAGLFVLHKCDTPQCVRPEHLFIGDHDENMRDKARKKRGAGERHPRALLTDAQARAIKFAKGRTQQELADCYGVSKTLIRDIRSGRSWRHIE